MDGTAKYGDVNRSVADYRSLDYFAFNSLDYRSLGFLAFVRTVIFISRRSERQN